MAYSYSSTDVFFAQVTKGINKTDNQAHHLYIIHPCPPELKYYIAATKFGINEFENRVTVATENQR